MSGLKTAVNKGIDVLKKFGDTAKKVANNIKSAFDVIKNAFSTVRQALSQVLSQMIAQFNAFVSKCQQFGVNVVNALVRGIQSVVDRVINAFRQMAQRIKMVWDALAGDARNAGSKAANEYASGYNNARPILRNPSSTPSRSPLSSPLSAPNGVSSYQGELLGAINSLNNNLQRVGAQPTNVNVTLSGSAKNIFDTVNVQNTQMVRATGYHALA